MAAAAGQQTEKGRQARARSAYHRFDDRGLLPKGRLVVKFRVICCCFPMSVPHILCSKSTFCQIRSDIALTYLAEAILMGGGEEVEEEEGNGNFTLLEVSVAVFESVCLDGGEPLLITYSP